MGIKFYADEQCRPLLPGSEAAQPEHFHKEFLCLEMAVKAVGSLEEAAQHINTHGSHHTDVIVTDDPAAADAFLAKVDSAGVYHNASSRFADGYRYGFGAEVGISTNRIHARGPVGLEGLLIYKYKLFGRGHTVGEISAGQRKFAHKSRPVPAPSEITASKQ